MTYYDLGLDVHVCDDQGTNVQGIYDLGKYDQRQLGYIFHPFQLNPTLHVIQIVFAKALYFNKKTKIYPYVCFIMRGGQKAFWNHLGLRESIWIGLAQIFLAQNFLILSHHFYDIHKDLMHSDFVPRQPVCIIVRFNIINCVWC